MKKFSLLRIGLVNGHLRKLRGCPLSVFIYLLSIANRWGVAMASYKEMGSKTGYSFPIVLRAIQKLKEPNTEGLPYIIPLKKRNEGKTQEYWLLKYNLDFLDWLMHRMVEVEPGDFFKKVDKAELDSLIKEYQTRIGIKGKAGSQKGEPIPEEGKPGEKLQTEKEEKTPRKNYIKEIKEIIEFLNEKTGKNFKTANQSTRAFITARLNEGRTIADLKLVIEYKCKEWLHDEKMLKYLRPSTLFRASNFENYVVEAEREEAKKPPKTKMGKETGRAYYVESGLKDLTEEERKKSEIARKKFLEEGNVLKKKGVENAKSSLVECPDCPWNGESIFPKNAGE